MTDVARLVLRVAFMNIPTKVGWRAWRTNFNDLARRGDVFGINEAGSLRAKAVYRILARRKNLGCYGLNIGPNPIFWDRDRYRLYSATQVRLHGAAKGRLARLWPGFNGARYCTVVALRPLAGGPLEVYVNWHWVAPGPKVDDDWREHMRKVSAQRVAAIIEHHRSIGRIVVPFGDINLRTPPDLGEHVIWLREQGVDVLAVALPAGVKLSKRVARARMDVDVFPAITDHNHGVSANIHLTIGAAA